MFNNFPINLGTTCAKFGGGSGIAQLTTSYTPAQQVKVGGLGNVNHALTVALGGSTATLIRVMDYSVPSAPRALLSTIPDDGLGPTLVHTVAAMPGAGQIAPGSYDLQVQLGGIVLVSAIEAAGTGMLTTSDTVSATGTGLAS